jgi:hypothetical protein
MKKLGIRSKWTWPAINFNYDLISLRFMQILKILDSGYI